MDEKIEKFGRSYYLLTLMNALVSIGFYVVNPILPKYLVGHGVALALASTIGGLFSLTALCVRPFTGIIADNLSPKRILTISIPLLVISLVGYAFCGGNVPMTIVFRCLNGFAFCVNGTTITSYASQFIPDKRMGEGIGYLGLGQVVASAIGPNIGVLIGDNLGYEASFLFAGIISAAALLMLLTVPDVKKEKSEVVKKLCLRDIVAVELLPIAFLNGLFSYSNGTVTNFLAFIADREGIAGYALYFTLLAVFLFALRPMAGRLNDKFGLHYMLIPAYLCTAIGLQLIGHASSLTGILLAAPLMAFGQGGGQPAIQAECLKRLGTARRGVATSTYYIFADAFQGLGPIIGGKIAEFGGYTAPFNVASVIMLCGLGLFLLLNRYERRNKYLQE